MAKKIFHDAPPRPATLFDRLGGVAFALLLVTVLYVYGLPFAVFTQLRKTVQQGSLLVLLSPKAWRDAVVANGLPLLLRGSDRASGHQKRETVFPNARGKVLELGAGTGLSIKYYDEKKVDQLFLVEPMIELHAELRKNVAAAPARLASRAHVIPFGVENQAQLRASGVEAGTFDTVCLVQVLCSIPGARQHLTYLQTLLKPGGQMICFEHVASTDPLTQAIQSAYNPIWTVLSGGCNVNRHSGDLLASLGGWKSQTIQRPPEEHSGNLYPHVMGIFVKA